MDMSRLTLVDAYRWMLPATAGEHRHAITLYGSRELLHSMDGKVLEQITNVAQLPGLAGAGALTSRCRSPGCSTRYSVAAPVSMPR
jgi:hypothetical protein